MRDEDLFANEALEHLTWSERRHAAAALGGFAILNNVKEVRRLAPLADIAQVDHNGTRPLDDAVGCES